MSRDPLDIRLGLPGAGAAIALVEHACAICAVASIDLAASVLALRVEIEGMLTPAPVEGSQAAPPPRVRFVAGDPAMRAIAVAHALCPPVLRRFVDAVQCVGGVSQTPGGGNWTRAMTGIAAARLRACLTERHLQGRLALLALLDERIGRAVRLLLREVASTATAGSGELGAMSSTHLLARAMALAAERHVGQRRKGAAGEPYVNHVIEVAALVAEASDGADAAIVAAALLHDTVEDTATSHAELVAMFGDDVAALVAECTDDKALPKDERKRLQVAHAPSRSPRAKLIKLADKTSNLRSLATSPPARWESERRLAYVAWARDVVAGLRGVSPQLEAQFDAAAAAAEEAALSGQPISTPPGSAGGGSSTPS